MLYLVCALPQAEPAQTVTDVRLLSAHTVICSRVKFPVVVGARGADSTEPMFSILVFALERVSYKTTPQFFSLLRFFFGTEGPYSRTVKNVGSVQCNEICRRELCLSIILSTKRHILWRQEGNPYFFFLTSGADTVPVLSVFVVYWPRLCRSEPEAHNFQLLVCHRSRRLAPALSARSQLD